MDAPMIDEDQMLSDAEEQRLYSYYNLDWSTSSPTYSGTGRAWRPSQIKRTHRVGSRY